MEVPAPPGASVTVPPATEVIVAAKFPATPPEYVVTLPKAGSEATTPEATVEPLPIAATTSPWSIVSVKEVEVPAVVWA